MTTAEAAATFDVRSFTPLTTKEVDDASARGRLERAGCAAASGRCGGVGLADRRARASTVRLRLRPVCGRSASWDRRGRRARRIGARACCGNRVVHRIRSCRRSCADDPHRRRLLRDVAAARIDRRAARRGGGRGYAGGRGRRELRRGHARAARAPGRSTHRRRGGLPRPARVPARTVEGREPRPRPRLDAVSGAAAARAADPARRGARATVAFSRCSATRVASRRGCADVERGACGRRGGAGRVCRRARGRLVAEAGRRGRAHREGRPTASARPRRQGGRPRIGAAGGEHRAANAYGNGRGLSDARSNRPGWDRRASAAARTRVSFY